MIYLKGSAPTSSASRHLTRLCKHFRHKVAVEYDTHQAHVDFVYGECRLYADDEQLRIEGEAAEAADIEKMRFVIEDHLIRMAHDETIDLTWQTTES